VVLVEFPHPGQKTIGFLTKTLTDSTTGELLAAVYVPTAINPTAGFLQIVPIGAVVETDMTMEQAMSLLLTGGAVGPDSIRFTALSLAARMNPPTGAGPDGTNIVPQ